MRSSLDCEEFVSSAAEYWQYRVEWMGRNSARDAVYRWLLGRVAESARVYPCVLVSPVHHAAVLSRFAAIRRCNNRMLSERERVQKREQGNPINAVVVVGVGR
jgi:hypothetical protein